MSIIHVASELSPVAKVGGLGDIIYGLSKELLRLNKKTLVILPKYKTLDIHSLKNTSLLLKKNFELKNKKPIQVLYWKAYFENIPLVLIDPQSPEAVFQRNSIYGEKDDLDRFLLFSFFAIDYICNSFSEPTTLHLHDWPTAFIAPLYHLIFKEKQSYQHKIILTLHNLMHQGRGDFRHIECFNIEKRKEFQDPQNPNLINLLKSGMLFADNITTVSPTYAQEISTPAYSYYLDETLWMCREKTVGILNGIDLNYWDPFKKQALPFSFPLSNNYEQILLAKEHNKEHLKRRLHLKVDKKPLFCCITRLDDQKGPFLLAHACSTILKEGGQYIILGKVMDPSVSEMFQILKKTYEPTGDFHFHEDFDEDLAKLIYASADFILIPSMFEPCGLTQMIAMRYGTIPIARKTGGLADTVFDIEDSSKKEIERTGICFENPSEEAFDHAIKRGFDLYKNRFQHLAMLKNILTQDFSWHVSTKKYLAIYEK